jgi:hypothetical protein
MYVCVCALPCVRAHVSVRERGVGEKESALGIKHYALQLFGCVSFGNFIWKQLHILDRR